MNALGEYLAGVARRDWNYGDKPGPKHDCCTFGADWVHACGYPDPMASMRGRYGTETEALEHIRKTGLLRFAVRGARAAGLKRTDRLLPGDVAVLRRATQEGDNITIAIRTGDRWATVIERGLVVDGSGEVVRAWRVEWARP